MYHIESYTRTLTKSLETGEDTVTHTYINPHTYTQSRYYILKRMILPEMKDNVLDEKVNVVAVMMAMDETPKMLLLMRLILRKMMTTTMSMSMMHLIVLSLFAVIPYP